MTPVIPIHPYQLLGRIEERIDRLNAHLLTQSKNDVLLYHVGELRTLVKGMRQSLDHAQRVRLEEQLTASIQLMDARRCEEVGSGVLLTNENPQHANAEGFLKSTTTSNGE